MRSEELREKFNSVADLVDMVRATRCYENVEWCGKEFTVGIDGRKYYVLGVPRHGNLYYEKLENFISDLFRLALGDDWTEMIDWRH